MKADPEQQLINPRPGSALAAARDFGIDLSLLATRLRLTPEERLRDLQRFINAIEQMRSTTRGTHSDKPRSDITTSGE
jgi:hypothetical protein